MLLSPKKKEEKKILEVFPISGAVGPKIVSIRGRP